MNRLPCCDRTTHRLEFAGFASLGLAGVMMVALALAPMSGFVTGRDRMAAARAGQAAPVMAPASADATWASATNVNRPPAARAASRNPAKVGIRSASEAGLRLLLR